MANNRCVRFCAFLLAAVLLVMGGAACAEERRLGDLVYVPAMQTSGAAGRYSLIVEGVPLVQAGEAAAAQNVAGAEFGVYVVSSDGELTPWANPLYPSEQMRIRSGSDAVSFMLPEGMEFYLRQESASEGYLYDAAQLIPVAEEAIVVRNYMPGELVVETVDSIGMPVAGVEIGIRDESGEIRTEKTDSNGRLTIRFEDAQNVTIEETSLPQGVYAARSVRVNGTDADMMAPVSASVDVSVRTCVRFEHPASGTVALSMHVVSINDKGDVQTDPLSGVSMEIVGQDVTIVTDDQGDARASLLEGTYDVRFAYAGENRVVLPLTEGSMIIESGATTYIELNAARQEGRIVLRADSAYPVSGGSVLLVREDNGESFGPYAFDGDGVLVSEPLLAGSYRVNALEAPANTQYGMISTALEQAEQTDGLLLAVHSGEATAADIEVLTREQGDFELLTASIDGDGESVYLPLSGREDYELIDEFGNVVSQVSSQDGRIHVEALSGRYVLRLDEGHAKKAGILAESDVFELPVRDEAIVFKANKTRLVIASVDENGAPIPGAVYEVTDNEGTSALVECGDIGEAVTPPLAVGQVYVKMISAPEGHDASADGFVSAAAGEAVRISISHESHGIARLYVNLHVLDEKGHMRSEAIAGAEVNLYRLSDDGQQMTDTGIAAVTGEDGTAQIRLEAGTYVARLKESSLPDTCRAGDALRIQTANMTQTEGELYCIDAFGGVRAHMIGAELTDELLAQTRFEIVDADGAVYEVNSADGAFYVGGLPEGSYTLRQTQIPEGYTLAQDRVLDVLAGEVTDVSVPLEEYAVLSVAKTGLTFNDKLQTFVVPLSGQYGVYTALNGEMKPYPSDENQMTVWSNVTPQQIAEGKNDELKLPAKMEGTTYYLKEMDSADGFAADTSFHEVMLTAGETRQLACAVSSDRGFFELTVSDIRDGTPVTGGSFELIREENGASVLSFDMEGDAYRNAMAIPVGRYILRQREAAPGYALSLQAESAFEIEPYLTQGGSIADVKMSCVRIPDEEDAGLITGVYAAREQQLTLITAETGTLGQGETLLAPQMVLRASAEDGTRTTINSVVLSGVGDAQGTPYYARVEYCLAAGGWQPSDARVTDILSAPTAVSFSDVHEDISAVRISYIHAATGEEAVFEGFTAGQTTCNVSAGTDGTAVIQAQAQMTGVYPYYTTYHGEENTIHRSSASSVAFEADGNGAFSGVAAGRDGRITGVAFFDKDADGVIDADEDERYAGLEVLLVAQNGETVETCRTDAQGRYAFGSIPGGVYTVRFNAVEGVVFSRSDRYSEHAVSGVEDTRYGESAEIAFDGDHTDSVVNVGCIYAAELGGSVAEVNEDGSLIGFARVGVELYAHGADDEEPLVVMSDDTGSFHLSGVMPGAYSVVMQIPDGYICEEVRDGMVTREITLGQGDVVSLGQTVIARAAAVGGRVMIDDDGDGSIAPEAAALEGVTAVLLRIEDGHTAEVARMTTDADGAYEFDDLSAGEYSVLFELSGDWTFTRHGEDSCVYGAVSQSGSSRAFSLVPGQRAMDMNAGVTIPAQMAVSVFEDSQFDGQKGVYEAWMEGVSISLIRLENGVAAESVTYRTDAEGTVVFTGVSPGEYVISYQLPGLWRATKQIPAQSSQYPVSSVPQSTLSTGESAPFTLTMGQTGLRMYIGAMLSGSVSGTVYYDDDADASLDDSEEFCEGVYAELLNAEHRVIADAYSGQDGSYSFEGLAPGRYYVRFTAAPECGFSATERTIARGGVEASDKNVSETKWISVAAGMAASTADAGVVRLGGVSGRIWEDSDADTAAAEQEKPLAHVTVNLMNSSGRNILATAVTDENGVFAFDKLKPDSYRIRVDAPAGYVFSGAMKDSLLPLEEQRDGRGYTAGFQLLGGAQVDNIGYGMLTQGSVSGRVWLDADYDGRMQADDAGVHGVLVTLYSVDGEQIAQQRTLRSGEFTFDGLMPGEYSLGVMLEEGYIYTTACADSIIGRQDEPEASVYLGRLEMGGEIEGLTIGVLRPAQLSGIVWHDRDDDGRRQYDDEGAADVRVRLTMTGGTDAGLVYETTTDETGAYRFSNVVPGEAVLDFTIPEGYAFTRNASGTKRVSIVPQTDAVNAGSREIVVSADEVLADLDAGIVGVGSISGRIWEDRVYDGRQGEDEAGVAAAKVSLVNAASGETIKSIDTDEHGSYQIDFVRAGEYMIRVDLPGGMIFTKDGESVIAMSDTDSGMTKPFSITMGSSMRDMDAGAIMPASVSGLLAIDSNEDGVISADEHGLDGVSVTLMQGGTAAASVKTGDDGRFGIGMLRPGTYRLRIALPEHAMFVRGTTLRIAHPDAQEGETDEFTLDMGQQLDAGALGAVLASSVSGRAWSDLDADGEMDSSESALYGVKVELLMDGNVAAAASTDEYGWYEFSLLRRGQYSLRFTLPDGMLIADRTDTAGGSCVDVVPGNVASSDVFALAMGEMKPDMNIGGIRPGGIGDTVWLDVDGNGLQDYKEPLIPGIELVLLSKNSEGKYAEMMRTTSDEYGYYAFEALRPGSYAIYVPLRDGDELTFRFGKPLGEIDSDVDPETGLSGELKLKSGQTMRNVDVGFTNAAD